ncbi:peptidase M16 domain protein [Parvibaculum lavamentivorans DS-1]|uniref:Peptidase M16 domain protein n=1 Tax=Parvibaculum lavamentivorans (strain DS-1 / DSM 13023 / NCIMB 13966) TaxID=402881 RepID=A7HPT0_PARL1|nr:pitrilysin family protein [Parvibaculum lavamentivorans]ABS61913.1 peptidase M16 domain protein [Parvibaculum lavamentivorans DS-1]
MFRSRALVALPFALLILAVGLGLLFGRGGETLTPAPVPESFTLSNGMNVLVIEDHRAPVVTHMVWYKIGAADETPGKTGIAHFLEHLMFKGTEKIAPGQFSRIVARNGGQDNAFTSYDFTAYFQVIAKDRLPLVMKMEADRMINLQLTDAEVLPERDVVLEEQRMRIENNPVAMLQSEMNAALYGDHPFGRDIIGYKEEIAALGTADALEFYERFYTPGNATLIVAGDITAEELRPLAEEYYGPIAERAPVFHRERPAVVWPEESKRIVRQDERVREPTWLRFYPAPSYSAAEGRDTAAFDVLAEILGGGTTSRLYRSVVVRQGLAAGIQSWYEGSRLDAGKFGLYALPRVGGDLAEVESAIEAEVALLLDKGVSDDELERAKTVIVASTVYARDSQRSMAYSYGEGLMTGLSVEEIHEWPELVRKVTKDDVIDAAKIIFTGTPSITGELLPEDRP